MELLIGRTRGPSVAPIVTTGPASAGAFAGAVGQPTTLPLFGGKRALDDWRSGLRVELGAWLDGNQHSGIGIRFYSLFTTNEQFRSGPNGRAVVNVPQSVNAGPLAIQIPAFVSFPGASTGRVSASAETMFMGGDVNWRYLIDRTDWFRVDTLAGYRQLHLTDEIGANFNVVPTATASESMLVAPQFTGADSVRTRNNFYGPQLGLCASTGGGRLWIEGHAATALGVTESSLDFARSRMGGIAPNPVAVLAALGAPPSAANTMAATNQTAMMQSNVANRLSYFGAVGEGGVRLNWRATDHVRFTAGYSFLYWNNVRRAQEMFVLGPVLRPQAIDFTTHLFSVGFDLRF
ncbi:BBP7 family outer membrane beta-barrel protein [Gemmata sp. G18]|uniref:BBP7 family outer membrane beta-barrel protein n=1 Tax=Gemmata palustris TaxID=2822762 RepID=A0ABS5BZ52_9BACT|nr:BBP7 family outer membrane beta-barrel protein [Gemmata palustris]MBP3959001.1 BBP7 family outer membrane beta-barrel protein [Gemmata palustris]